MPQSYERVTSFDPSRIRCDMHKTAAPTNFYSSAIRDSVKIRAAFRLIFGS